MSGNFGEHRMEEASFDGVATGTRRLLIAFSSDGSEIRVFLKETRPEMWPRLSTLFAIRNGNLVAELSGTSGVPETFQKMTEM